MTYFKKSLLASLALSAIALSFSSTRVYAEDRPWYEDRIIADYLPVPLQMISGQWHFDLAAIESRSTLGEPDWQPLGHFTNLTNLRMGGGLGSGRRIDHMFVRYLETPYYLTLADETETILRTPFQDMDLRSDYELHPLDAEEMIIRAINYHRFENQFHSYERMQSLSLAAIHHSIEMRDRQQHSQEGFGGESHQERMELWTNTSSFARDYIRSSHVSSNASTHTIDGPFTQEEANRIVDHLMTTNSGSWFVNAYYHYIGVGVGVQADGRVRLTVHMSTARGPDVRDFHVNYVRGNREEAYAEFAVAARSWFIANRRGESNPYR